MRDLDEIFNGLSKFAVDILPFLPFVVFRCADKKWGYRFTAVTRIGEMLNGLIKLTLCAYRPWIRSDLIVPAGDSKVAAAGYLTGFLVGSFVERHYIHYEIPFGSRELGILSCIGAGFMITWKEYIAPATFVACLGGHWGTLGRKVPAAHVRNGRMAAGNKKGLRISRGRRGRIETFQQERTEKMTFYRKIEDVPMARVIDPVNVDWEKEGLEYREHVMYGSQSPRQHMDIWAPKGAKDLPAVIWIHGGGWNDENLTEKYRPEPELARLAKLGFVCASIEYRLAKHAPFPAQIEDCKCAVRFLRANAEEFGIDPDKIGAWGESAGGHLTALLAATAGVREFEGEGGWNDQSSEIQAAVPWYAPYDMVKSIGAGELCSLLYGGGPEEKKDLIWASSPMKYAGAKLPPMLCMHGDMDRLVPAWQTLDFYRAARDRGNPVELVIVPGQGHGFFDGDIYYEAIELFFRRTLREEY